jgi:beta-lactamase superfamily II metal-dependent hydrolase
MYEVEYLGVGEESKSGEAILLRFTNPEDGQTVTGVIDAGFADTGPKVVEHVARYYGGNAVDFVLSTHPDGDHINGMGYVMRHLRVGTLLIHRPAQHGHPENSGAEPAEELATLAAEQGAAVMEPFAGVHGWGDAFLIAGPTEDYYEQMLADQEETTPTRAERRSLAERYFGESAVQTVRRLARKALAHFPVEVPFGDAGGTNPRNNSSAILSLFIGGKHLLFFGDAGVPAISEAMDFLDDHRRTTQWPSFVGLPHHGSRHNLDLDAINRVLGPHTDSTYGATFVSVSTESDLPSPRVANAFGRRGYPVSETRGATYIRIASADAPARAGLQPLDPLPPLEENDHDD